MTDRIAEFVATLPQDFPDVAQQLFHLVPAYHGHEYVIASSCLPWMDPIPEVIIFAAHEIEPGIYEAGTTLAGPDRYTLDSKELFEDLGYEVLGGEKLPELRPITGPEMGVEQEFVDRAREDNRRLDPSKYLRDHLGAKVVDEYMKPTDEDEEDK